MVDPAIPARIRNGSAAARRPRGRALTAALVAAAALLIAASPATADPVFNIAGLSVDVISPNGDLVQDLLAVTYTIGVDTAQVAVLLTPSGGGSTLAVLQPLTRQGRGPHAVAFDGRVEGTPLPDGPYDIVLFGVGTGGEGEETRVYPFAVDTAPPVILSLDPVEPADAVVQNGDAIVLDACIDGDPVSVTADFSDLDTAFDPSRVVVTSLDERCRRIRYTVTPANDRTDAAGLGVTVTATDAGGNVARGTARYCLSNEPPRVTDVRLINELPYFQNRDRITAEITFDSPALVLSVTADCSNLDSEFDPSLVAVRNLGAQRYEVSYTLDDFNARPDGAYRLVLIGRDPGCGVAVDSSLVVHLDNAGTVAAVIANVTVSASAFSPNGDGVQDDLGIAFSALEDTVFTSIFADVRTPPDNRLQTVAVLPRTPYLAGNHEFPWDGSLGSSGIDIDDLADQTIKLTVLGVSTDNDRRRNFTFDVALDRRRPELRSFQEPTAGVRNGQRLDFSVTWDQPGLLLRPDFSALDSRFTPESAVGVTDNRDGSYAVSYVVSADNERPDSGSHFIPIAATDPAGNTAVSTLVKVCLNNDPPALASAVFVDGGPPFSNGHRIKILAVWTGSLAPFEVTADFSALDSGWEPGDEAVDDTGDGRTFEIEYRITSTNARDSGTNLPIVLTAANLGCATTRVTAFRVELDNKAGPRPVLDPVPSVVRLPEVTLTGEALEADSVEVRNFAEVVDRYGVVNGEFIALVPLNPGENRLSVVGIDGAGNRSSPSSSLGVFFVDSSFFEVPPRFAPGGEFFVGLLQPADEVIVHVFNLDGVEIRRLSAGPGDLFRLAWDGGDDAGSLASSGPYLAVLEIHGGEADGTVLRKAFVFTRRGPEEAP